MKNLYDDNEAKGYEGDLALRVYTSNLLGRSDELVLHGGGNTSVKIHENGEDILYVKGSGWDLVSIKKEGFAPVRLDVLIQMAQRDSLSDTDMVKEQKEAMTNKQAPSPSVEAILHAIIPFKFIDHTHSDAVVTISNSVNGQADIAEVYKDYLIMPYVMPGFILAKEIYERTQDIDWSAYKGIILHNHGIFTYDDNAKNAYTKMIDSVTLAEDFLSENAGLDFGVDTRVRTFDVDFLLDEIEARKGHKLAYQVNQSSVALHYANQPNLEKFATRGVLTPEHIIRTKRKPLVIIDADMLDRELHNYEQDYIEYFDKYKTTQTRLNTAPNYAVVQGFGVICFGKNEKEASIISDIVEHTMLAVLRGDKLGGYVSIDEKDSFEMEYWELEQNKLKA